VGQTVMFADNHSSLWSIRDATMTRSVTVMALKIKGWDLRSFLGILHSRMKWSVLTDVSGQPIDQNPKCEAVQENRNIKITLTY